MLRETFGRRFTELDASFYLIHFESHGDGRRGSYVPDGQWQKWATSAQNLIRAVFGELSPHYQHFVKAYEECRGEDYRVRTLNALFLSAKEDFEGGYVFDVELTRRSTPFASLTGRCGIKPRSAVVLHVERHKAVIHSIESRSGLPHTSKRPPRGIQEPTA